MPRDIELSLPSPEQDATRQFYLRRIIDRDPAIPEFSHLLRYPETHGPFLGMQDVLETALDRFYSSSKPQIIAIVGHHATGKTTNIKLAIDYIERRSSNLGDSLKPTLVTYDSAIEATGQAKTLYKNDVVFDQLDGFDPRRRSGNRGKKFYRAANYVFGKALKTAIQGGGIILVEAPATGGIVGRGKNKNLFLGKDRGTSTIRNLSSGEGYEDLEYDLVVTALVADSALLLENFRKRASQSIEERAERSGATAEGTEVAGQELIRLLASLRAVRGNPEKVYLPHATTAIATKFFPWILNVDFLLREDQSAIFKNSKGDVPEVTKENIAPYDIFKRASEDQILQWLLRH